VFSGTEVPVVVTDAKLDAMQETHVVDALRTLTVYAD